MLINHFPDFSSWNKQLLGWDRALMILADLVFHLLVQVLEIAHPLRCSPVDGWGGHGVAAASWSLQPAALFYRCLVQVFGKPKITICFLPAVWISLPLGGKKKVPMCLMSSHLHANALRGWLQLCTGGLVPEASEVEAPSFSERWSHLINMSHISDPHAARMLCVQYM